MTTTSLILIASLNTLLGASLQGHHGGEEKKVIKTIQSIGSNQLADKPQEVVKYMTFPIPVECLADKERGGDYDQEEFISKSDLILDDKAMQVFAGASEADLEKLEDEDGATLYRISVNYAKEDEDANMTDEYARGFVFKKVNGDFVLYLVNCAG